MYDRDYKERERDVTPSIESPTDSHPLPEDDDCDESDVT